MRHSNDFPHDVLLLIFSLKIGAAHPYQRS